MQCGAYSVIRFQTALDQFEFDAAHRIVKNLPENYRPHRFYANSYKIIVN
jgi:hypothetical protein